jgi:hypothetical protein
MLSGMRSGGLIAGETRQYDKPDWGPEERADLRSELRKTLAAGD